MEEDGSKGGSRKLGEHGPFCLLLTMTVWWNNWLDDYEGNDIRQKQSLESILHRGEKYWWGWEVTVYFKARITYVSDQLSEFCWFVLIITLMSTFFF